jgi:hypothetical protein
VALAKSANAEARMKFLQQQVEVFSRFTGGEIPGQAAAAAAASKKKKAEARTRMTEEEEDQALMEAGRKGVRATRLTVQPGCASVCVVGRAVGVDPARTAASRAARCARTRSRA